MMNRSVRNIRTWKKIGVLALIASSWLGGIASLTAAAPQTGILRTADNSEVIGEIEEKDGNYIIQPLDGRPKFLMDKRGVANVTYFKTAQEEFTARFRTLGGRDLRGRILLGKWAVDKGELGLAEQALASARQLDPRDADVVQLDAAIQAKKPKPVAPVTQPTAPTTKPVAGPAKPGVGPAKRLLTADEIAQLRFAEMRPRETMRIQINPEARKQIVATGLVAAPTAKTMTPVEIGLLILEKGDEAMRSLVKVQSDPAALMDYRTKLNKALLTGCAAAACHGGPAGGNLVLFGQPEKEETSLTNFVSLQKFEKEVQGARRLMIDRLQPEQSLLLNYMLPLGEAQIPHPKVENFRPAAASRQHALYTAVSTWMGQTLKSGEPKYADFDLTAPPPVPAAKAGAAPKP